MPEGMTPEMMQRFQQMGGGTPSQGGTMRGQGSQAGQGGPRDTAAFRRMMQNNPEMRQRMQNAGRDSLQRRNPGQQGQGQNPQRQNQP
jgi:hypothetical protein